MVARSNLAYFALFFLSTVLITHSVSEARLCRDQLCNEPISMVRVVKKLEATGKGLLSLQEGDKIYVYSKEPDKSPELWYGELEGQGGGYFPKEHVEEYIVYDSSPKYVVSEEVENSGGAADSGGDPGGIQKPQESTPRDKENKSIENNNKIQDRAKGSEKGENSKPKGSPGTMSGLMDTLSDFFSVPVGEEDDEDVVAGNEGREEQKMSEKPEVKSGKPEGGIEDGDTMIGNSGESKGNSFENSSGMPDNKKGGESKEIGEGGIAAVEVRKEVETTISDSSEDSDNSDSFEEKNSKDAVDKADEGAEKLVDSEKKPEELESNSNKQQTDVEDNSAVQHVEDYNGKDETSQTNEQDVLQDRKDVLEGEKGNQDPNLAKAPIKESATEERTSQEENKNTTTDDKRESLDTSNGKTRSDEASAEAVGNTKEDLSSVLNHEELEKKRIEEWYSSVIKKPFKLEDGDHEDEGVQDALQINKEEFINNIDEKANNGNKEQTENIQTGQAANGSPEINENSFKQPVEHSGSFSQKGEESKFNSADTPNANSEKKLPQFKSGEYISNPSEEIRKVLEEMQQKDEGKVRDEGRINEDKLSDSISGTEGDVQGSRRVFKPAVHSPEQDQVDRHDTGKSLDDTVKRVEERLKAVVEGDLRDNVERAGGRSNQKVIDNSSNEIAEENGRGIRGMTREPVVRTITAASNISSLDSPEDSKTVREDSNQREKIDNFDAESEGLSKRTSILQKRRKLHKEAEFRTAKQVVEGTDATKVNVDGDAYLEHGNDAYNNPDQTTLNGKLVSGLKDEEPLKKGDTPSDPDGDAHLAKKDGENPVKNIEKELGLHQERSDAVSIDHEDSSSTSNEKALRTENENEEDEEESDDPDDEDEEVEPLNKPKSVDEDIEDDKRQENSDKPQAKTLGEVTATPEKEVTKDTHPNNTEEKEPEKLTDEARVQAGADKKIEEEKLKLAQEAKTQIEQQKKQLEEEAQLRAKETRRQEEVKRQLEEENKRKAAVEDQLKKLEEARKKQEELRLKDAARKREEMEMKRKAAEEEARKAVEEARKKQEEVRLKEAEREREEMEIKRKAATEEARKAVEEARKKQEELRLKEAARKQEKVELERKAAEETARKVAEEKRRKEEEEEQKAATRLRILKEERERVEALNKQAKILEKKKAQEETKEEERKKRINDEVERRLKSIQEEKLRVEKIMEEKAIEDELKQRLEALAAEGMERQEDIPKVDGKSPANQSGKEPDAGLSDGAKVDSSPTDQKKATRTDENVRETIKRKVPDLMKKKFAGMKVTIEKKKAVKKIKKNKKKKKFKKQKQKVYQVPDIHLDQDSCLSLSLSERLSCGEDLTEDECHEDGCCYDDSISRAVRCFYPPSVPAAPVSDNYDDDEDMDKDEDDDYYKPPERKRKPRTRYSNKKGNRNKAQNAVPPQKSGTVASTTHDTGHLHPKPRVDKPPVHGVHKHKGDEVQRNVPQASSNRQESIETNGESRSVPTSNGQPKVQNTGNKPPEPTGTPTQGHVHIPVQPDNDRTSTGAQVSVGQGSGGPRDEADRPSQPSPGQKGIFGSGDRTVQEHPREPQPLPTQTPPFLPPVPPTATPTQPSTNQEVPTTKAIPSDTPKDEKADVQGKVLIEDVTRGIPQATQDGHSHAHDHSHARPSETPAVKYSKFANQPTVAPTSAAKTRVPEGEENATTEEGTAKFKGYGIMRRFKKFHEDSANLAIHYWQPVKRALRAAFDGVGLGQGFDAVCNDLGSAPPVVLASTLFFGAFGVIFLLCTCLRRNSRPEPSGPSPRDVLRTYEARIRILEEERDGLENSVRGLELKGQSARVEQHSLEEAATTARKSLEQVIKKYKLLETDKNSMQTDVHQFKEALHVLELQIEQKDEEIDHIQEDAKHFNRQVKSKEEEIDQLKENLKNQEQTQSILEEQISTLKSDVETQEREKNELSAKVQDWNDKYDNLQRGLDDHILRNNQLQEQYEFKCNEVEVLQDCLLQIKGSSNADADESDEHQSEDEKDKTKVEKLQSMLDASKAKTEAKMLQEENDKITKELRDNNTVKEELEEKVRALEHNLLQAKASEEKAKVDHRDKDIELAALRKYFKDTETDLHRKLTAEESARVASETQLQSELSKASSAVHDLDKYRKQYSELKDEIGKLQESFRTQVADVEERAHTNWLKFRTSERELDEIKRERDALRRRFYAAEKEKEKEKNRPGSAQSGKSSDSADGTRADSPLRGAPPGPPGQRMPDHHSPVPLPPPMHPMHGPMSFMPIPMGYGPPPPPGRYGPPPPPQPGRYGPPPPPGSRGSGSRSPKRHGENDERDERDRRDSRDERDGRPGRGFDRDGRDSRGFDRDGRGLPRDGRNSREFSRDGRRSITPPMDHPYNNVDSPASFSKPPTSTSTPGDDRTGRQPQALLRDGKGSFDDDISPSRAGRDGYPDDPPPPYVPHFGGPPLHPMDRPPMMGHPMMRPPPPMGLPYGPPMMGPRFRPEMMPPPGHGPMARPPPPPSGSASRGPHTYRRLPGSKLPPPPIANPANSSPS